MKMESQKSERSHRHQLRFHNSVLPVVISGIEQLGPPAAIARISDESQRGPLLVTLAVELTLVIVGLIQEGMHGSAEREEREVFMAIRGGESLRLVNDQLERCRQEKEVLITKVEKLERRLLLHGLGQIVEIEPKVGIYTICAQGDYIVWSSSPADIAETAEELRREYEGVAAGYRSASLEVEKWESRRSELLQEICSAPDYRDGLRFHLKARGLKSFPTAEERFEKRGLIDFKSNHSLLRKGVAAFLREREIRWWSAFEEFSMKTMRKISSRGFVRLMLRDGRLAEVARWRADALNLNPDGGWLEVIANPQLEQEYRSMGGLVAFSGAETGTLPAGEHHPSEEWIRILATLMVEQRPAKWPPYTSNEKVLGENAIRYWRLKLREEEQRAGRWMNAKSGGYHPCNWLVREEDSEVGLDYPVQRALDELSWCLGGGGDFEPFLSSSWTAEKWQAWCKQARSGAPNYWTVAKKTV